MTTEECVLALLERTIPVLAKAIAYKQCGKDGEAEAWVRKLVELLDCENILTKGGYDAP